MSSKSHPKHPFLPTESSTSARHSFNSHRFAAESSMMNTHAQTLLKAGTIDSAMATQLSQPWHRTGEVRVQYSKDYLQMHPDYTGENAHEMPTLNWAMRKQRERDRKAKEWLERYFSEGADGREVDEERKEEHKDKNAVEEQQEEWETETATATSSANAPSSPGIRRTAQSSHLLPHPPLKPTSLVASATPPTKPIPQRQTQQHITLQQVRLFTTYPQTKSYVHGVPEEDGSSGEDGKDGGKQGGSGTDSEVQEKKVGSEEAFEDFTWKKGGKRKRDDDEGDGKDGEAKKVKLTE
ncbi:hypothetical protein SNOG_10820 [Parastagonospora nodorum SN15]|uniref:Uncharacterized protein n=1 Tax=Phaeosphaeria nodorum (strain SN15 / ATCC MYA-4574 / FGSC 10173) TaxID=321614 RepID=Q0UBP4_PHANO|nr:hypothetical protein SNOG_10820 [Parastagonospora nodorum SN15]EAT82214.2 hypothetical protein SNOG_10820 [Parastagonospora nodorum SN15]